MVLNDCDFFFLPQFSFTDTSNSQDCMQGNGGNHLLFHSTTSTCSRTFRHLFATLHERWLSLLIAPWDLPPYRITIWLIDETLSFFVCLHDDLILAFLLQQFEAGNRWIRTRINYHPSCITSEPTNRVIQLKYLSEYCFRSSSLSHYTFLISKQFTTNYLAS